jgi:hypothetical protein
MVAFLNKVTTDSMMLVHRGKMLIWRKKNLLLTGRLETQTIPQIIINQTTMCVHLLGWNRHLTER